MHSAPRPKDSHTEYCQPLDTIVYRHSPVLAGIESSSNALKTSEKSRFRTMHVVVRNGAAMAVIQRGGATPRQYKRLSSTGKLCSNEKSAHESQLDVQNLLSKPTWSVASLLPPKDQSTQPVEISSKQLHHLLRLSALPPPKDADEEAKMLSTLSSQLHFVKQIQKVDTTGVEPLRSLRDETAQGDKEAELGMEALADALAQEKVRGKYHKRIRRQRDEAAKKQEEEWDVFGTAERKVGRFFVVESGKSG